MPKKMWTQHALKNIPANWNGTKAEYESYYLGALAGLIDQIEEGFAKDFGNLARTAMLNEAEGGNAKEKIEFPFTFDFSDVNVPSFSGYAVVTETRKHKVTLGYTKEVNTKQRGLPLSGEAANGKAVPMESEEKAKSAKKKTAKAANKGNPAGKKVKPAPSTKGSADEDKEKES